jgi:hypothetical protein
VRSKSITLLFPARYQVFDFLPGAVNATEGLGY